MRLTAASGSGEYGEEVFGGAWFASVAGGLSALGVAYRAWVLFQLAQEGLALVE